MIGRHRAVSQLAENERHLYPKLFSRCLFVFDTRGAFEKTCHLYKTTHYDIIKQNSEILI